MKNKYVRHIAIDRITRTRQEQDHTAYFYDVRIQHSQFILFTIFHRLCHDLSEKVLFEKSLEPHYEYDLKRIS